MTDLIVNTNLTLVGFLFYNWCIILYNNEIFGSINGVVVDSFVDTAY